MQDDLPYCRGLASGHAHALLGFHGFSRIEHWEGRFAEHPYAHQAAGACSFSVVTAVRPPKTP